MGDTRIYSAIEELGEQRWQQTLTNDDPFLAYPYLAALEANDCLGQENGWQPRHLHLTTDESSYESSNESSDILMPVYLKDHSYGEFVFDWSWARAAHSVGIPYYPKLVTAIPFTPVTGPRFNADMKSTDALLNGVRHLAEETGASSWHLLFPDTQSCEQLLAAETEMQLLERRNCHFIWKNRGYGDFDDFLESFSSRKRKNIRKERKKLQEQEVEFQRLSGSQITAKHVQEFYDFYQITYHRRGQPPYLNLGFFQQLLNTMPERLLLVRASRHDHIVGAALFIESNDSLYGRWWGGVSDIDCLHFEACYYQGIEYAIEKGLKSFDPGIQGEHKLLRGFEPVQTRSLHWIREPSLSHAVERWLKQERREIDLYQQQARQHLPFKQN
ncbi:MAG: GNAT family N-acetyltransferase [Motiliproteus sp.]|nr:GNAT family N-acetyltransferase [Motiliproteus sp.]